MVGAGPNGLGAAATLAGAGWSVLVLEAGETVGGAARTAELTLPGFLHDLGSAVHPLGIGSPLFGTLPLEEHGLEWVHPEVPLAHPLDGGRAVALYRSLEETAEALGRDGPAYRALVEPFFRDWPTFADHLLGHPLRIPRDPVLMGRFALRIAQGAAGLAWSTFRTEEARALLAGNAAHAGVPLERPPAAAVGLVLMVAAHAVGWPVPRGGAGAITQALARLLEARGGVVKTGRRVRTLAELPERKVTLLDLTPRQVRAVAGDALPGRTGAALDRWSYGPGAFKVDWALDGPIPWTADACRRAGTIHLGGTLEEVARAERMPWEGHVAERPFVLLAQPSLFDPTRAPAGRHTAWAYGHVPNGWTGDLRSAIEAQVERFAPGFGERILAARVHDPVALEAWNPNLVGGDVAGGAQTLLQTLARPTLSRTPWRLADGLYLCSASTPPGGGVHGMCGFHAAQAALADARG